jgi:hypothetical protein
MELQRELGADLSVDVSYEWYVMHTHVPWECHTALLCYTPLLASFCESTLQRTTLHCTAL